MADVVFPEYVETFIAATNRYLGSFDFELERLAGNHRTVARLGTPSSDLLHRI
jgi:hypothetical protein